MYLFSTVCVLYCSEVCTYVHMYKRMCVYLGPYAYVCSVLSRHRGCSAIQTLEDSHPHVYSALAIYFFTNNTFDIFVMNTIIMSV